MLYTQSAVFLLKVVSTRLSVRLSVTLMHCGKSSYQKNSSSGNYFTNIGSSHLGNPTSSI